MTRHSGKEKNAQARLKGDRYIGFQKNNPGKYEQTTQRKQCELKPRCKGHRKSLRGHNKTMNAKQFLRNVMVYLIIFEDSVPGRQKNFLFVVLSYILKHNIEEEKL